MSSINKQVPGYPDVIGGSSRMQIVDHYGPASYTTGGEIPFPQSTFGGPNSIGVNGVNWMSEGVTESGNYRLVAVFGGGGSIKAQPKYVWYVVSTGAQVAAAVNLSAEVIRVLVIGG